MCKIKNKKKERRKKGGGQSGWQELASGDGGIIKATLWKDSQIRNAQSGNEDMGACVRRQADGGRREGVPNGRRLGSIRSVYGAGQSVASLSCFGWRHVTNLSYIMPLN